MVRSGTRPRPVRGSGASDEEEAPSTTQGLATLRPPSTPELTIETVTARSSWTPGTPTSIELRGLRAAPSREKIEQHIEQLLEARRPVAAAEVLMIAGRCEEALELFLSHGVHHQVGACLRKLGHPGEAIAHLMLTDPDGPHYREACREIARCAVERTDLDPIVFEYLEPFSDSGPRSQNELGAFLDLAEIFHGHGNIRRAARCLQGVLRMDPDHPAAQLMQLTWMAELSR